MSATHPLLNYLILLRAFSHLSTKERLQNRLVCSLWNRVLVEDFLGPSVLLKFVPAKDRKLPPNFHRVLLDLTDSEACISETNLEEFCDVSFLWIKIPGKLVNGNFVLNCLKSLKELEELKVVVYPSLSSAAAVSPKNEFASNFDQHSVSSLSDLRKLTYYNLTNLEQFSNALEDVEFPIPFNFLFDACRLEELKCNGLQPQEVTQLLKVIQQKEVRLTVLEILDENRFTEVLKCEDFQQFSLCWLPQLHSLSLELSSLDINPHLPEDVSHAIEKCCPNLRQLTLRRFPIENPNLQKIVVPWLESLEELELSEGLANKLQRSHDASKSEKLRSLKLSLRNPSLLSPQPFLPEQSQTLLLTKLEIEHPLDGTSSVRKIAETCGKTLKELKLRGDNEVAWEIFEKLPELENLHLISWDGLTDYGLNGINPTSGTRDKPALFSLKKLKLFVLEMWPDSHNGVRDAAVMYGIRETISLTTFIGIRTKLRESSMQYLSPHVTWELHE